MGPGSASLAASASAVAAAAKLWLVASFLERRWFRRWNLQQQRSWGQPRVPLVAGARRGGASLERGVRGTGAANAGVEP